MLDGYLHAIAIGPQTIMPSQWLPKVWGQDSAMMPPMDTMAQLNHIMGLVMRHYNSIISGFEQKPPSVVPCWDTYKYNIGEFEDAEGWAYGFTEGVTLNRAAWKPMFDSAEGQKWYRPIGLLGEDSFSADQDELTQTPAQREQLANQIEDSLLNIHAFGCHGARPYMSGKHHNACAPRSAATTPAPAAVARSSRNAVDQRLSCIDLFDCSIQWFQMGNAFPKTDGLELAS
jgi:uncharacterized protein